MVEIHLISAVELAITNKNSVVKLPENPFPFNYSTKMALITNFLVSSSLLLIYNIAALHNWIFCKVQTFRTRGI